MKLPDGQEGKIINIGMTKAFVRFDVGLPGWFLIDTLTPITPASDLPPRWAVEEAQKRLGVWLGNTPIASQHELARMIAKYEPHLAPKIEDEAERIWQHAKAGWLQEVNARNATGADEAAITVIREALEKRV